jgi:hypothetical protein
VARFENPADAVLFARVTLFAAAVPALLRLPLPRLERMLEPRRLRPAPNKARTDRVVRHVEQALARARPLVRPGCLTRSVTLYYFLRRAGEDVTLCFGLGRVNGRYEGHAWLTKDGRPFLEPTDPTGHFTQTYAIPAATTRPGP